MFLINLIFGGSEMGVVRFLGVASLEFEEFVSTYNKKKCWAADSSGISEMFVCET